MRGYEINKQWVDNVITLGYESPCGVMSRTNSGLGNVTTRYESPCGVMSAQRSVERSSIDELRIPMRGYENC